VYIAAQIDGQCEFVSSAIRSLTFRWAPAKSATSYRLVGHSKSSSVATNGTTVNGLTPGLRYTFTVWAVGWRGLVSNNITCTDSTGLCRKFLARKSFGYSTTSFYLCSSLLFGCQLNEYIAERIRRCGIAS